MVASSVVCERRHKFYGIPNSKGLGNISIDCDVVTVRAIKVNNNNIIMLLTVSWSVRMPSFFKKNTGPG